MVFVDRKTKLTLSGSLVRAHVQTCFDYYYFKTKTWFDNNFKEGRRDFTFKYRNCVLFISECKNNLLVDSSILF